MPVYPGNGRQHHSALNRTYPGWQFQQIAADERPYCVPKDSPFSAQPSLVWGDFDHDGQIDYATLIKYSGKTMAIVFLKRGTTYRAFPVFTTSKPKERAPDMLTVTHQGDKYFDHATNRSGNYPSDTVVIAYCESSVVAYIYIGDAFNSVRISD